MEIQNIWKRQNSCIDSFWPLKTVHHSNSFFAVTVLALENWGNINGTLSSSYLKCEMASYVEYWYSKYATVQTRQRITNYASYNYIHVTRSPQCQFLILHSYEMHQYHLDNVFCHTLFQINLLLCKLYYTR